MLNECAFHFANTTGYQNIWNLKICVNSVKICVNSMPYGHRHSSKKLASQQMIRRAFQIWSWSSVENPVDWLLKLHEPLAGPASLSLLKERQSLTSNSNSNPRGLCSGFYPSVPISLREKDYVLPSTSTKTRAGTNTIKHNSILERPTWFSEICTQHTRIQELNNSKQHHCKKPLTAGNNHKKKNLKK